MTSNTTYQELYHHLAPKLYAVCLRYTKNKMDAEDCLQEAFIKIFNHLDQFKNEGALEAWARRIVVNTILESFRKRDIFRNIQDIDTHGNYLPSNDVSIASELSNQELLAILQKLPEGKRLIFNLFCIEGYTHKEIASMLDISEGTSKSQLAKAKELLVNMLQTSHSHATTIGK